MALLRAFAALHVFLYRLSGGRVGGKFRGSPVLLLTTIGRSSGRKRTTPVLYLQDGRRWLIVASNGGRPKNPAWWFNLKANPQVEIQIRSEILRVLAKEASREEGGRLWPRLTGMYSSYDDYQKKTEREIPVIILEPLNSERA